MGLIRSGIDSVRAVGLPAGVGSDGEWVAEPRLALVRWRSGLGGRFHQVYVNGRYAGTTSDSSQRQMVVQMPTFTEAAVRIEVFGVEACEAHIDFSERLGGLRVGSGRVGVVLLRSQELPMDGTAHIYYDAGTGVIDYTTSLTDEPIRIWPARQDKAGFGMSRFGRGDFGYDSSAAVGFGMGSFGNGQFGLDADVIEWISPPLQEGVYRFAVKVFDSAGKESSATESDEVAVIPGARPAESMSVSAYERQTNRLVLSVP